MGLVTCGIGSNYMILLTGVWMKIRIMVGQGVFFAGDPVPGEEQEVQERPKEGGVWPLENICNTFSSTCNTCTASSNIR